VLGIKLRAGLLGLLAMLLLGSYAAAPAFAEGGPFCHHRPLKGEGEGDRIKAQTPEQVLGEGREQFLVGKLGTTEITIKALSAQVKGIIYNNEDQCQTKVEIQYHELSVINFPGCIVKLNSNNIVKLFGHQVWKWNGTKEQLVENPQAHQVRDWLFLPTELQQGATGLPTPAGTYTNITFRNRSGKEGCILASVQNPVTGSATVQALPYQLGTWNTTEEQIATGGEGKQHFWNGKEFIGFETGLFFAAEPAKYEGSFNIKTTGRQQEAPQEIAYFEK
jgi:hypothetical protein